MISTICILGDHIQSLGIARIVGRLGYNVILINDKSICISRFSRYCRDFILFQTEAELLHILMKIPGAEKNILLVPTNDKLVNFVMNNYSLLEDKFFISTPSPSILGFCFNKKFTYQKAADLNIPIPESYYPENLDQLVSVSKKMRYPVIIKPAIMYKFYKRTGQKVWICHNPEELKHRYLEALEILEPAEIIIQKIIKGGAKNLYSFCSFFANGQPYGSFIANRIRQKPMDFGISTTFAVSINNEEIQSQAMKFLEGINYFGLSELEFMYDADDDAFKIIEINARTWKWHSIANKLGINLLKMLIDYFNKLEIYKQENKKEKIGWIETITDSYVAAMEIFKGKMSITEYWQTIKIEKEFACFDIKDPLPAFFYILFLPYLYLVR